MHLSRRVVFALGAVALTGSVLAVSSDHPAAAARFGFTELTAQQRAHVSGFLLHALGPQQRSGAQRPARAVRTVTAPQPGLHGCPLVRGSDVKVNQNCLNPSGEPPGGNAQMQNETAIAADPNAPGHLVAAYNDYRRSDSTCGVSYSLDAGRQWADTTVPNTSTQGFRFKPVEDWQVGGDPSLAWDDRGNVYLSCLMFNRGPQVSSSPDQSSGLFVYRSTGTDGASFDYPASVVRRHAALKGGDGYLLDKPLIAADNHPGSPFENRVYVTWTKYAADGTAYEYEAYSANYGRTFSAPVPVSGTSPLCADPHTAPTPLGRCNDDQFGQPFVGPDGTLYVVFDNYNLAARGLAHPDQVLLVRSSDGGASFSAPVRVAKYFELPDCDTYQGRGSDSFSPCIPEKGPSTSSVFRAANYAVGAVDPTDPQRIAVTLGSYVNRYSDEQTGCTPHGRGRDGLDHYRGVKRGGCNNQILLSVSGDGGRTFSGATASPRALPTVDGRDPQHQADEWFQGTTFTSDGTLVTSFYDRSYGSDEHTGFSDVSVTTSTDLSTFASQRATTSSLPPPTQFFGTFWGDYAGVDAAGGQAYPVWSDTRAANLYVCPDSPPAVCTEAAGSGRADNDQDVYARAVPVPGGT